MSPQIAYTEAWLQGPQSTQFYSRTYNSTGGDTKAVIVFIHGFAEHVGRYTHFHPLLSTRGIAVFAIDQRGFGKTALDVEGHKSKHSAYGKTSWKEQMADIAWAIGHAKKEFPGLPLILMGHSMGGAEVLGFATQDSSHEAVSPLVGLISTSPLIQQTTPVPKLLRWAGGIFSNLAPNLHVSAGTPPADLSHDAEFNDAYAKDPLIKSVGTLRGAHDMLSHGEALLQNAFLNWPENLPVLLFHGTGDRVTSHKATQMFHDKIKAHKKEILFYEGAFHELQNEPDGVKEKLANDIVVFVEALCETTNQNTTSTERSKL